MDTLYVRRRDGEIVNEGAESENKLRMCGYAIIMRKSHSGGVREYYTDDLGRSKAIVLTQ